MSFGLALSSYFGFIAVDKMALTSAATIALICVLPGAVIILKQALSR
jgi:hypothetical protein